MLKSLRTMFVFVLLALLGVVSTVHAVSPYSLIPLESPVAVSVDLPAAFKLADFQGNETMNNAYKTFQESLGMSVENDLLPWVGQAAVALTDTREGQPKWAYLLQIRDADQMVDSARLETILHKMFGAPAGTPWLSLDYKGVAIRRTQFSGGWYTRKIAVATLDGWLVIALGDGVIRKVIDTHNGSNPSLESQSLLAKAMSELPANSTVRFCVNGQGILSQTNLSADSEMGKFCIVGAMALQQDDLNCYIIATTSSPSTQAVLKKLHSEAGTITGDTLAQLPEGAFATLLVRNPDKWVGAVEQIIVNFVRKEGRRDVREAFAEIGGLRTTLQHLVELGASGIWREGQGFGITVVGETDDDLYATAASEDFRCFIEEIDAKVQMVNGLYSIASIQEDSERFPLFPCWTSRKEWLLGATHPGWIAQPDAETVAAMPDNVKGADLAIYGDFSFIQPMMKSLMDHSPDPEMAEVQSLLSQLNSQRWAFTLKIDEDGSAVRCRIDGAIPIVSITSAILFPVFGKARERARQASSMSNLRQLALALNFYMAEHEEKLPVLKTTADTKKILDVDDRLLISPRTHEPYTPNPYVSGKSLGEFNSPTTMIIFYEKTPGLGGSRVAAFLDGHVELIQEWNWEEAKRNSKIK